MTQFFSSIKAYLHDNLKKNRYWIGRVSHPGRFLFGRTSVTSNFALRDRESINEEEEEEEEKATRRNRIFQHHLVKNIHEEFQLIFPMVLVFINNIRSFFYSLFYV